MILGYAAWEDREVRAIAVEHGATLSEVREAASSFSAGEWWVYVLAAFEAGEDLTVAQLRALPEDRRRSLLRTHRALSDRAVSSHLSQVWAGFTAAERRRLAPKKAP